MSQRTEGDPKVILLVCKPSRGPHGSVQVLGDHVDQKGSIVQPERLRFDFSHNGSIDTMGLARIEAICQDSLSKALPVYSKEVSLSLAKQINGDTPPLLLFLLCLSLPAALRPGL